MNQADIRALQTLLAFMQEAASEKSLRWALEDASPQLSRNPSVCHYWMTVCLCVNRCWLGGNLCWFVSPHS